MLKKLFDFFVFTSLFIAGCAVVMTWQAGLLFGFPLSFELAGFVFSGTVCSYNFHWWLTPPEQEKTGGKLAWNVSNKNLHLVLSVMALLASGVFAILLLPHWEWLMVTAFFTFLYSAPKIDHPFFSWLKKIAVGKTIFLAFAWTHVTAILPLLIYREAIEPAALAYVVHRFFFIYALCILFDYRDVEEDRRHGIRSMITLLDEAGIDRLFWGSLLASWISLIFLAHQMDVLILAALSIPLLVLAFLYHPSKKNFSDYRYYFVLDGLMMLSAPLLLLTKFAR